MADITDLIFEDHEWFRRQFFYLDEAKTVEEMTAIWEPLATRLDTHADAEERIFYPALLQEERRPGGRDRGRDRRPQQDPRRRGRDADGTRSAADGVVGSGRRRAQGERRAPRGGGARGAARLPPAAPPPQLKHKLAMEWLRFTLRAPARPGGRRPGQGPGGVRRGALLAASPSARTQLGLSSMRGRPARRGACAAPR